MPRPTFPQALKGAAVALAVAAAVNAALFLLAGDALRVDDMGLRPVVVSTLAMIPFAALVLWRVPRLVPAVAFAVAAVASPFAFMEFGAGAGVWLTVMHFVAAAAAAFIAPRVAWTSAAGDPSPHSS